MPRRRGEQNSDWTGRYHRGDLDAHDDETESSEPFSDRSKNAQQSKMQKTALLRAGNVQLVADGDSLPMGEVIQIHSLYVEVMCEGVICLAVVRKTLQKLAKTAAVVGDMVRLRKGGTIHESGMPEAVVEQVLPRETILVRQDSFRKDLLDPIVANAQQMLIVASIRQPRVKWGLVDRMLIAAESGGLVPIICLNKIDLIADDPELAGETRAILDHYRSMKVRCFEASVSLRLGMEELREVLQDRKTVLAGHSGVGKSSLIGTVAPGLDIKVGEVSTFNEKGRHTTSSAKRYPLPFGGFVIDTPGVKQFGLVGIDAESLINYFPDVADGTAPAWRVQSYDKLLEDM